MKQKMKQMFWMCFFCFGWLSAQQIEVKGVVISKTDNQPLMGVSVIVKDKTIGTSTDIDGNYLLRVSENDVLTFSYIGFKTLEVPVQGRKQINISLEEEAQMLEEVVTVGYRTERKADLTGAVSVVDVDQMMSASENNPIKALQGRVAGMQVSNDGNPAGKTTVRIRGVGTLNNNDPLYIIDGVPTQAGMHELNSNDIESIQVLRDASAASIYGSRAANGVIIVTTKKGKQGVLKIDFDHYTTVSMFQSRMKMLNSEEYARILWKASVNDGRDANTNGLGIYYDESTDANGYKTLNNLYFPKQYYDRIGRPIIPSNTDWFDEITRMGVAQSYNLSVMNGTEKGNYFFSLGYYNNEGLVKYTDFSRLSARINSDYKLLGDVITIGENFTINRTSEVEQPYQITEAAMIAVPFIPVHTADGKGWAGPVKILNDRQNPARLVYDNQDNRYNYWRIFGNAFVNIQPIEKFNIRSSFGLDYGNFYKRVLNRSYVSGFLEETKDRTSSALEQAHWTKWNWSNTLTYDFQIGDNRFETLAGMEMFQQNDISFGVKSYNFAIETPDYMWPSLGTGSVTGNGNATGYKLMSFFGKINYAYADRYLASATLRYDGSSRFHKDHRWGTFPAFNLGWRISQEAFMENLRGTISDLKLRLGWGQNGNQEIGNYSIHNIYNPYYGVTGDYIWNAIWNTSYDIEGKGTGQLASGFKRDRLGNQELKWETTTQTNFGIDFAFFDNTLYSSAEYYIKQTKDILVEPPYAGIKGEGATQWVNGAGMENKGFELSVGYRNETASGLKYDINANFSTNKNKVTELPESVINAYGGNGKWDNILGRPYGSHYGYVADGIFKTQDDLDKHSLQNGKAIGRIRYKDLNNDGVVDEDDRTWIGSPYPDFIYGLNVNLEYKNFDLSLFLQGVHNVSVVNDVKKHTDFWSAVDTHSNKGQRLLDAFDPITNPNSDIPSVTYSNTNQEDRFSTYYVENGSYLKLRNVQLGYSLPKDILANFKMSKLRFYVSGQNLFTIKSKNFTGQDPENPNYGYPIPMTFTIGLNASF
ncbi:SusC/RagA family TonB-linked outer membrane protein [Capnocytophaga catalasegens]|nr:TonB-dependent receptor [Capnocytophaga catalasegens]